MMFIASFSRARIRAAQMKAINPRGAVMIRVGRIAETLRSSCILVGQTFLSALRRGRESIVSDLRSEAGRNACPTKSLAHLNL